MVYECFYFYNELDLLELKLHELYNVVDYFVLLEFETSLLRQPQPLYYEENKERFKAFSDKIIHIVGKPNDYPHITDAFGLYLARKENYMQGLIHCQSQDIIISSDPDVIFKKESIAELKTFPMDEKEYILISDWYCYYMDFFYTKAKFGFNGATYYKNILAGGWASVFRWKPAEPYIKSAGYHFSKLGGIDNFMQNLSGYPHQELNNKGIADIEKMKLKMERGVAWDNPNENGEVVMTHIPYDPKNYPQYVNEHPEIYSKYFKGGMTC